MIRNYFKTAWRNITRTRGYSALNIAGLGIGMAVTLLIGLYVYNEYSYDRFLPDYNRLYRVQRNFDSNGDTLTFRTTSMKLAYVLRTQVPQIQAVAESDWMGSHGLSIGDKKFFLRGGFVGGEFLSMFRFPLLQGNATTALADPYSIVLTESTAKSFFGNENPIGKTVRYNNKDNLKVTGILKDIPNNSSLQFNYLIPHKYLEPALAAERADEIQSFGNNHLQIFVQLKPGISYSAVAPLIRNIEHTEKNNSNAMKSYVTLQPLQRWHLYSNYVNGKDLAGFLEYVKMFSIIGILVLLIACINFINLTTARSEKRAKEVGVRKAIGSQKKDLIFQFLMESLLLTFIAAFLAMILVVLCLPAFNTLTQAEIKFPFANPVFWIIAITCIVFIALVAGSRPAFYLSSFKPVAVLKGNTRVGRAAAWPRKIMVVLQFSCSVALITSTIVIYQQIQYAKNRPTGYDLNRLLMTDMNDDLAKNFEPLKNELLQKGIVSGVTSASSPATDIYWHTDLAEWPGKNAGETVEMGAIRISDTAYFKTLGISFKEGRNYFSSKDSTSIIFNEAAINRLRIKDPIGKQVTWNDMRFTIAGVTRDALMLSPFSPADPTMFMMGGEPEGSLMYRLSPSVKTQGAITQLGAIFNKYNPAFSYTYEFADTSYGEKFQLEMLIGKLAAIFATLAIFISCLGLFGLAAYTAEQRRKEISIRKVLGASVSQMWFLLSRDFITLVIISSLIASPIAYYFLHDWLQKYDYRVTIGAGVFVISALVALLITLVTISSQAIKAALANPAEVLKTE